MEEIPSTTSAPSYELIADTRERNVLRHTTELPPLRVLQMTVGDYAIMQGGAVVAIIERKSLEDYAASLKDGRCSNINKLIKLRETTNCRIIYIIEGREFPAPESCWGNIPYKHIESSIFHLVMRDNVCILRSKDSLDTAKLLYRLMASMRTLEARAQVCTQGCARPLVENYLYVPPTLRNDIKIGAFSSSPPDPMMTGPSYDPAVSGCSMAQAQPPDQKHLLTAKVEIHDSDIVRKMWACFPGIGAETASTFMAKYTIADAVLGLVNTDDMKTACGRRLSTKIANSLSNIQPYVEVKIITCTPGISRKTAVTLSTVPLKTLLSYGVAGIAMKNIGKKPLGKAKAERLVKYLTKKFPV
jgi:hypothetical protein